MKKLLQFYRNLKQPVKAAGWFLICSFLQKGIAMLTTPIFTRVMTEAEYGSFSEYNSWFSILQIIVSLNLAAGVYTRGLVKNESDQARFSSSLLGLSTTIILTFALIFGIFHTYIEKLLGLSLLMITIMLVDIWSIAAYQFWSNRERVNYQYKRLVGVTLSYVILRPCLSLVAVLLCREEHQMEMRVIATAFVNFCLFSVLYFSITKKGKCFYHKEYWRYALRFNLPLLPHYLSQVILSQSDRLMISKLCGTTQTAYYSVAYTLATVLQLLNNSISGTMNPWIYKTLKSGDPKRIGKVSNSVLLLLAATNLLVVLAAPELLRILAPESYQEAVWIIPPVTISVFFMFLYNLFATFEYYYEKTGYVMIASASGALLNIILNYIFIPKYGYVAAGYTTLVSYILYALMHYAFLCVLGRKNPPCAGIYSPLIICAIALGLIACSALVMLLYDTIIPRYALLLLLCAVLFLFRKKILAIVADLRSK